MEKFKPIIDRLLGFLPTLLLAVIVYIVAMIVIKIVLKIMSKALEKSKIDPTAHGFLKSLVRVVLFTLAIVITLSTIGIPMSSIVAVIGAAGLAVGLALQNSLSNVAGGFIILFEKPFKVGDYIASNGEEGTVESISILATRILTVDNKVVYIPNGQVSNGKVVNYSEEDLRRVDLNFSISYEDDFAKAKRIIEDLVSAHEFALKEPAPTVRMLQQADSAIVITTRVWTATANYWDVYFDLTEQVKAAFDKNGITIPYNQITVHMDK